jgi:hypothetical protein
MNAPAQSLKNNPGNQTVRRNLIFRTWQTGPGRSRHPDAQRKHRRRVALVFLLPLGTAVVLAFLLRGALPHLPRQEFEGLGAVLCAFAYIGIFLRQVSRALTQEEREEEELESHRLKTPESPLDTPNNPT